MDTFEAIKKRHSYRDAYIDQPVPREDLVKIVQAGIDAPSACNEQSTSFVIIDDPYLLAKIRDLFNTHSITTAKAIIACVCDPRSVYNGITFHLEDCSAAIENMMLALTSLGYASVWYDSPLRGGPGKIIGELLGVPKGHFVYVLLPVGVPENNLAPKEKRPFAQRAWFNGHGRKN